MEYFWKENKKFVIAVTAMAVAALVYNSFVLSSLSGKAALAVRTRLAEESALKVKMARGVPGDDAVQQARGDLKRSNETLKALAVDLVFKQDEKYTPPSGETPKSHYDDLKDKIPRELGRKGVDKNVPVPRTFGLDAQEPGTDEAARELLFRLSVAERLVALALEAGATQISAVDALHGEDGREPAPANGAFVRKLGASIQFKGDPEAGFRVLHALQKKGTFFAVQDFKGTRDDPTKTTFTFFVGVRALRVDAGAPLEAKAE